MSISQSAEQPEKQTRHWDWGLIVVTLIAVALRTYRPGIWYANWDELNITFWAQRIGRYGEWLWLSNNWIGWGVSWNPISRHSALSNYTAAIPYWFSASPLGVRFFVGLLGGLSIGLTYHMVRRYTTAWAAWSTGLMFAFSITTNEAARRIINANLALFFIAVAIYTGLLAYYERKRWAFVIHWVALSMVTQYHPTNVLLVFGSIVLFIASWIHNTDKRGFILRWTAIGIAVGILVGTPWLIGSLLELDDSLMWTPNAEGSTDTKIDIENPTFIFWAQHAFQTLSRLTVSTEYRAVWRINPHITDFYPPQRTDILLYGYVFAALGMIGVGTVTASRQFWRNLPYVYWALALLPLLLSYIIAPRNVSDPYYYAIPYGFFPLLGVLAWWISERGRVGRMIAVTFVGLFIAIQAWLTIGTVRWTDNYGWYQPQLAPMETYRALARDWSAQTGDVVVVVDTNGSKFSQWDAQRYFWDIMTAGLPVRVINRLSTQQGLPINPNGTYYASLSDGATLPRITDGIAHEGYAWQLDTDVFQTATLSADDIPDYDFIAQGQTLFGSGARMIGAYLEGEPAAGEVIPLTVVWSPEVTAPELEYQFSVRLIDESGTSYGQRDFRSLDRTHWRAGETVINPTEIALNDSYSPNIPLRVQILMYRYDNAQAVDVVDESGQPVAPWVVMFPDE